MHSWRIYLACALLASGASNGTIQLLLRWRSEEALKIYARMNDNDYANHLSNAALAKVSSVRTTTLADEIARQGLSPDEAHTAFHGAWLALAARSTINPDMSSQCPVHTSDDLVSSLNDNLQNLRVMADKEDHEA